MDLRWLYWYILLKIYLNYDKRFTFCIFGRFWNTLLKKLKPKKSNNFLELWLKNEADNFLLFNFFKKTPLEAKSLFLLFLLAKSADLPGWMRLINKKEKIITFFDISKFNVKN